MPVRHDSIADEILEFCALQISWHHLALGEGTKRGGVPYLPAEFDAGYRGLQVVRVRQHVCLNLNGIERIGSCQTDMTSALRTHDACGHRPRTGRWVEPGRCLSA